MSYLALIFLSVVETFVLLLVTGIGVVVFIASALYGIFVVSPKARLLQQQGLPTYMHNLAFHVGIFLVILIAAGYDMTCAIIGSTSSSMSILVSPGQMLYTVCPTGSAVLFSIAMAGLMLGIALMHHIDKIRRKES